MSAKLPQQSPEFITTGLPGNERFHGLDAARAIALFIGIFHHGIESFVTYSKGDWITQDSQSSILIDILFYVSHVFRMQAFFLMSGFFAHLLVRRKGIQAFKRNRFKRLFLPFIICWPFLYFFTYQMWVWGVQYVKHIPRELAVKQVPDYMVLGNRFPLMHLWFLYFLILYCAIVVIVYNLAGQRLTRINTSLSGIDHFMSMVMNRWWGSLVLGAFMVLPMWGMIDGFGVDTSAGELLPRLFPFIIYGLYFILGWLLFRQLNLMECFTKYRKVNLGIGAGLILALIVLSLLFSDPPVRWARLVLAALNTIYAFASICSVFAFLGYMQLLFAKPGKVMRYLSDGAYWGYLIHLPVIGFFQILLAPYHWFWGIKLLLIFTPSLFILWFTYQFGVRNTNIGLLLNGKKYPRKR